MTLVYYCVYKRNGAILSKQPVNSDDPSVGRINVDYIPPPHTAKSIMRCISKIEEVGDFGISQLFTSISVESPVGDGHVSILTDDRPGSTPEKPMAIVILPGLVPRTEQPRTEQPCTEQPRTKGLRVTTARSQSKFKSRRRYHAHLFARNHKPKS